MLYRQRDNKTHLNCSTRATGINCWSSWTEREKKGKLVPVSSAPLERGIALGCDLGAHENHR